jgi:hypothetical protein
MKIGRKIYTAKKPAHPDDAHTKAKRFFKRKGRKRARQMLKRIMPAE